MGVFAFRSDYISDDEFKRLCRFLPKRFELICKLMDRTGLRVADALALRTEQLRTQRPTVIEAKTGKHKRIFLSRRLQADLIRYAGQIYAFPGRKPAKPLTRQAVHAHISRAAKRAGINKTVSPHSFRKRYAVRAFHRYGLKRTMRLLNHDNMTVTLLYAFSDKICEKPPRSF